MTKLRAAGSCAKALWDMAEAVGRQTLGEAAGEAAARAEGIAQIAKVLGIEATVVRNMLNPDRTEQLSLERAGLLMRTFGLDLLARWLAAEAGGTFIPLPPPTGDMEKLTAAGVRAAGETAAQVIEARAGEKGGAITADEARKLSVDCRQVMATFGEIAAIADRALRPSPAPALVRA